MTDFTDPVVFKSPTVAWSYDSSVIDPNAARFNFYASRFAGVNWNDPRANVTFSLGYNFSSSGTRENTAEPSIGWVFESYWVPVGGVPSMEAHLTGFDTSGMEHRLYSAIVNRDGNGCVATFRADKLNFQSYDSVQRMQIDAKGGVISLLDGTGFLLSTNNKPLAGQINAARTRFYPLPYIDDQDRLTRGSNWTDTGGNEKINGYIELRELPTIPDPPTGNLARLYLDDDGTGKTRVMVVFANGSRVPLAVQN